MKTFIFPGIFKFPWKISSLSRNIVRDIELKCIFSQKYLFSLCKRIKIIDLYNLIKLENHISYYSLNKNGFQIDFFHFFLGVEIADKRSSGNEKLLQSTFFSRLLVLGGSTKPVKLPGHKCIINQIIEVPLKTEHCIKSVKM